MWIGQDECSQSPKRIGHTLCCSIPVGLLESVYSMTRLAILPNMYKVDKVKSQIVVIRSPWKKYTHSAFNRPSTIVLWSTTDILQGVQVINPEFWSYWAYTMMATALRIRLATTTSQRDYRGLSDEKSGVRVQIPRCEEIGSREVIRGDGLLAMTKRRAGSPPAWLARARWRGLAQGTRLRLQTLTSDPSLTVSMARRVRCRYRAPTRPLQ